MKLDFSLSHPTTIIYLKWNRSPGTARGMQKESTSNMGLSNRAPVVEDTARRTVREVQRTTEIYIEKECLENTEE